MEGSISTFIGNDMFYKTKVNVSGLTQIFKKSGCFLYLNCHSAAIIQPITILINEFFSTYSSVKVEIKIELYIFLAQNILIISIMKMLAGTVRQKILLTKINMSLMNH